MPRVALVTGSSGGFGIAIVERLRDDGFVVEGGDLTELDVTNSASVDAYFASALERHGRVDVLVNNAGVSGPTAPVDQYPVDEWRHVLDVNLTGTFLCMRGCVPTMRELGYGRIVNVASSPGRRETPRCPLTPRRRRV